MCLICTQITLCTYSWLECIINKLALWPLDSVALCLLSWFEIEKLVKCVGKLKMKVSVGILYFTFLYPYFENIFCTQFKTLRYERRAECGIVVINCYRSILICHEPKRKCPIMSSIFYYYNIWLIITLGIVLYLNILYAKWICFSK